MKNKKSASFSKLFDKFSNKVTKATGSPLAFVMAFLVIVVWGITGPLFHFSDTWQLVINTSTTIVTFLMVFVIQQSQNKDTLAIHLKLNELISVNKDASNRLIDVEDLTEDELMLLKKFYIMLADLAESNNDLHSTHSIDEAAAIHEEKIHSRPSDKRKPGKSSQS